MQREKQAGVEDSGGGAGRHGPPHAAGTGAACSPHSRAAGLADAWTASQLLPDASAVMRRCHRGAAVAQGRRPRSAAAASGGAAPGDMPGPQHSSCCVGGLLQGVASGTCAPLSPIKRLPCYFSFGCDISQPAFCSDLMLCMWLLWHQEALDSTVPARAVGYVVPCADSTRRSQDLLVLYRTKHKTP